MLKVIYPEPLKIGDKVGLVAPAGLVERENIAKSIKAIKRLGLKPVTGNNCTKKYGYLAGKDDLRAYDINAMFADKSIKGIFALRGGYGSQRLLDKLDWDTISLNPKIFTGYSDITALHIAINQKCNFITFHAPMAAVELSRNDIDKFTLNSFIQNISIKNKEQTIKNPKGTPFKVLVEGKFEGTLTGGNLTLVTSSLGTNYEVQTEGKVLFLEEIGEPPYKIDRMLMQLKNAGKLYNVSGIVLGYFTDCEKSKKESLSLIEVFKDILAPIGKPCIYNVACGHQLPTLTLAMGGKIKLS